METSPSGVLRMNVALRGKRIANAFRNVNDCNYQPETTKFAFSLIIPGLGSNPLLFVHNFTTTTNAWDKLPSRHASKSVIDNLKVHNSLIYLNFEEKLADGGLYR